jgi:competence protein ComEA
MPVACRDPERGTRGSAWIGPPAGLGVADPEVASGLGAGSWRDGAPDHDGQSWEGSPLRPGLRPPPGVAPVSLPDAVSVRDSPPASVLAALNPGRRAVKALVAVGLVVVLIAAFVAWRSRPRAEVVAGASPAAIEQTTTAAAASAPPVAASSAEPSASSTSGMIVVAVTGRVKHPGLVSLPAGSRVADAIAAAGGVLPKTDLSFVNLARKVADGELIVIGVQPSPGMATDPTGGASPADSGGAAGGPVDINTATLEDLETLPGIGPALAQRILDYRTQHGSFHSVDELQNVSGIGPSKFAEIKAQVTV